MEENRFSFNQEREATATSGWGMLGAVIVIFIVGIALLVTAAVIGRQLSDGEIWALVGPGIALVIVGALLSPGFFTLEPNETRVLVLFGAYKGTVRQGGFRWANPFYSNGPTAASTADRRDDSASGTSGSGKKGQPSRVPKRFPRYKISVRARTLNGPKLKVNDRRGNPVEIATVVVWRVRDTAQAVFDVEDF